MNDEDLRRLAERAGFEIDGQDICIEGLSCNSEVRNLVDLLLPRPKSSAIQSRPVDRYIVLYAEAEELLAQIREQHEANYGIEPSDVDWGDVGSLVHFVDVLQFAVMSLPNRQT